MRKTIIVSVLALLLVVGTAKALTMTSEELKGFLVQEQVIPPEESLGAVVSSGEAFDIAGTKTGTTTVGRYWGTPSVGSTTYPILLNPLADSGVFTISPTEASSTQALLTFSLFASNDTGCDTATTSSDVGNPIQKKDINWSDAGDYVLTSTQDNPFAVATTTITFPVTYQRQNRQIYLEKLNSRCLMLEANGSSVAAWIQFKQNSK